MNLSLAEENYLKSIFQLLDNSKERINTNSIAEKLQISAATVTDMIRKLSDKKLLNYQKYYGVHLTAAGKKMAISIIRRHRLWELFLVEKLGFKWGEVHEIAEQLEHVKSDLLVERLYNFLGRPECDPHGDPIPDESGNFPLQRAIPLSDTKVNIRLQIAGVNYHETDFLDYLDERGLLPGKKIKVNEITQFDRSMDIQMTGQKKTIHISHEVASKILVEASA
ncbi:MAG: metal-dependent transcriptional regulator [Bacteroidetes bacterium]|nr:metal-dependent transcriptional regulator [Bacteroidota bacterium]